MAFCPNLRSARRSSSVELYRGAPSSAATLGTKLGTDGSPTGCRRQPPHCAKSGELQDRLPHRLGQIEALPDLQPPLGHRAHEAMAGPRRVRAHQYPRGPCSGSSALVGRGSWASAASSRSTWSTAVLAPAFQGHSQPTRASYVWSNWTPAAGGGRSRASSGERPALCSRTQPPQGGVEF
jgi:hypothetical protein